MKGIAFENLSYLILAAVLIAILITLFFMYNSSILFTPMIMVDELSSKVRATIISFIWITFFVLISIITVLIATSGMCRVFPVGTAVCAAMIVGITAFLYMEFNAISSGIPFVFFGPMKITVDSQEKFNSNLVDRIVDCEYMLNHGNNDPLAGISDDPKQCFIITVKGDYNLSEALNELNDVHYPITGFFVQEFTKPTATKNYFYEFKIDSKTFGLNVTSKNISVKFFSPPDKKWFNCKFNDNSLVLTYPNNFNFGYFVCYSDTGTRLTDKVNFYFKKVDENKYSFSAGDLILKKNLLQKPVIVVYKEGNNYVYKNANTLLNKNCIVSKDSHIFIEFYDSYFNSIPYSPECGAGNNYVNFDEGTYVCIDGTVTCS